jgi:hypothetical protein
MAAVHGGVQPVEYVFHAVTHDIHTRDCSNLGQTAVKWIYTIDCGDGVLSTSGDVEAVETRL